MRQQMSLCDVCPQPKSNRPCSDCGSARAGMNAKAIIGFEAYDLRCQYVVGCEKPKINLVKSSDVVSI